MRRITGKESIVYYNKGAVAIESGTPLAIINGVATAGNTANLLGYAVGDFNVEDGRVAVDTMSNTEDMFEIGVSGGLLTEELVGTRRDLANDGTLDISSGGTIILPKGIGQQVEIVRVISPTVGIISRLRSTVELV